MQRRERTVCFDELLIITRPCCTWKQKSNCNGLIIVRGDNESLCSVYWVNTNSIMYWRSENQIPYTSAQLIQTTEKHRSWPKANTLLDDIQGGLFDWSTIKMTKCQTLKKFWHSELFWRDLHVICHFLGRTSQKNTLYMGAVSTSCVRSTNNKEHLLIKQNDFARKNANFDFCHIRLIKSLYSLKNWCKSHIYQDFFKSTNNLTANKFIYSFSFLTTKWYFLQKFYDFLYWPTDWQL